MPDISLNAVANLGYAEVRFGAAVHDGDTLTARSTVIGLKENSNRETGIVYVRTDRHQPARRDGAELRALGHGAQARQGGAGAGGGRPAA